VKRAVGSRMFELVSAEGEILMRHVSQVMARRLPSDEEDEVARRYEDWAEATELDSPLELSTDEEDNLLRSPEPSATAPAPPSSDSASAPSAEEGENQRRTRSAEAKKKKKRRRGGRLVQAQRERCNTLSAGLPVPPSGDAPAAAPQDSDAAPSASAAAPSAPDDSELGAVGPAVDSVAPPPGYGVTSSGQLYKIYLGSAETQRRLEGASVFKRLGPSPPSVAADAPSVDPLPAPAEFRIPRTSSRDHRAPGHRRDYVRRVSPSPPSTQRRGSCSTKRSRSDRGGCRDSGRDGQRGLNRSEGDERPPVRGDSGHRRSSRGREAPRRRSSDISVAAPAQVSGGVSHGAPPPPLPLPTLAPHVFFDGVRWVSWCPVRQRAWVRRGDRWFSPEPADRP